MTDAETSTAPPAPEPDLHDIVAFLSGHLNYDLDRARDTVNMLHLAVSSGGLEYDQGHAITDVPFDLFYDMVLMCERLVELAEDQAGR